MIKRKRKPRKNPDFVEVYRFSKDGFKPKYQNYLENLIKEYININKDKYPIHLQQHIVEHNILKGYKKFLKGIFVFINKPDLRFREHLTNHIKNRKGYNWYKGIISKETPVFLDKGYILEEENIKIAGDIRHVDNVYIPEEYLKVSNIEILDDWDTEIDYDDPYYKDF